MVALCGPTISHVAADWSLDARILIRPAQTFEALAAAQPPGEHRASWWLASRRPIFIAFVLGCVISLLGSSVASVRLVGPTAIYWSFVPLIQILALIVVTRRRRAGQQLASLIDTFFAGHAAWTLLLLATGAILSVTSPMNWWFLIIGPAVAGVILVAGWSAYVDLCFFRFACGSPPGTAIGQLALHRFITWTLIVWIFAVPEPTPLGVFQEIVEAIKEVMR